MLNPNSKITFTLSPKRKRSRANESLDVGSPTSTGFILINKALRCIHYKKYNESVSNLKITKKVLNVENLFKYELGVFMFKFINNLLPINFRCYFKSINKVHNHSTRTSKTNFFLPRFNNKYGHKSLAYQGSKLWTDLLINLKEQSHLGRFQVELKDNLLNDN